MSTAFLLTDLSYGDSGKGSHTDHLCSKKNASLVVRYNGGPQAAHNVVTNSGIHHTFSQFGSGYFQKALTYLSEFMFVDPLALMLEAKHLKLVYPDLGNPLNRLFINKWCPVVTPYHRAANRLIERFRNANRHGSCGIGVGQAVKDYLSGLVLRLGDFSHPETVLMRLDRIRERCISEVPKEALYLSTDSDVKLLLRTPSDVGSMYFNQVDWASINPIDNKWLAEHLDVTRNVVFEGAQGVLLDESYGFHPFTTWSNTTFDNALKILKDINFNGIVEKCGIVRAFSTRHGPGPFVPESKDVKVPPTEHNKLNDWQGNFRAGVFDVVATDYAMRACKDIDYLAMSHLDARPEFMCRYYEHDSRLIQQLKLPNSLKEQEALTNMLLQTSPRNCRFSLEGIEESLGIKVK